MFYTIQNSRRVPLINTLLQQAVRQLCGLATASRGFFTARRQRVAADVRRRIRPTQIRLLTSAATQPAKYGRSALTPSLKQDVNKNIPRLTWFRKCPSDGG